jgi:hypothetical protein
MKMDRRVLAPNIEALDREADGSGLIHRVSPPVFRTCSPKKLHLAGCGNELGLFIRKKPKKPT